MWHHLSPKILLACASLHSCSKNRQQALLFLFGFCVYFLVCAKTGPFYIAHGVSASASLMEGLVWATVPDFFPNPFFCLSSFCRQPGAAGVGLSDVSQLAVSFPHCCLESISLCVRSFGPEPSAFHLLSVCPCGYMSVKQSRRKTQEEKPE